MTTPALTFKLYPTNCYLLKLSDGDLLIDTSFPNYFEDFLAQLKSANIEPTQIKYLLLTHHHDDHAGFASQLREKSGCRLIAHKEAVVGLERGTMVSANRPLNRRVKLTMSIYNRAKHRDFAFPRVTFSENDILISADDEKTPRQIGIDGKIICTPGHTADSISLILANGDAYVGDACMNFLNFCGIHYRPIWLMDPDLVFRSWRKIINSGAKTIYPSHGKPFMVEELIRYGKKYAPQIIASSQRQSG